MRKGLLIGKAWPGLRTGKRQAAFTSDPGLRRRRQCAPGVWHERPAREITRKMRVPQSNCISIRASSCLAGQGLSR
jgi:hypothetical protein